MTHEHRTTDVLVIGAGPGGYVAAVRARQLGLDVTLVEADAHGGACLNRGCIPSKALISAASIAHEARTSEDMGITADVDVDFEQLTDWKDQIVRRMGKGVERLCKSHQVELVNGRAEFVDPHVARIVANDDEEQRIRFERAIIATGSEPIEIAGFEFDRPGVFDAGQALSLSSLPDSLLVVGGGYIGMELSIMFAKLGVDITVVEALDSILPSYPSALVEPVHVNVRDLGVDLHLQQQASGLKETNQGVIVETKGTESQTTFEYGAEGVLVAVGRNPVTKTANVDAIGLEPTEGGYLSTDEQCRTEIPHVFAVGDVAGEPMLAHKSSMEGKVAAEVIAGHDVSAEARSIPKVAFTSPEIATVGLSRKEANEAGYDVDVGEFPFRANGRALTTGHSEGFVRLVVTEQGAVLGGQIIGPEASELIGQVALAVDRKLPASDLAETVFAHPTLSESVHEAAGNALGRAIHTTNR